MPAPSSCGSCRSIPRSGIAALYARGREESPLADEFPHLAPLGLKLIDGQPAPGEVDVAFLALPHGQSAQLAVELANGGTTVIDIGSDLRLADPAAYPDWYGFEHPAPEALADAVYGLTEFARDRLPGAKLIANPGCYPTAALLALTPFARAGLLTDEVIVDAKSGVSGAGRSAGPGLPVHRARGRHEGLRPPPPPPRAGDRAGTGRRRRRWDRPDVRPASHPAGPRHHRDLLPATDR